MYDIIYAPPHARTHARTTSTRTHTHRHLGGPCQPNSCPGEVLRQGGERVALLCHQLRPLETLPVRQGLAGQRCRVRGNVLCATGQSTWLPKTSRKLFIAGSTKARHHKRKNALGQTKGVPIGEKGSAAAALGQRKSGLAAKTTGTLKAGSFKILLWGGVVQSAVQHPQTDDRKNCKPIKVRWAFTVDENDRTSEMFW